jgi:hypothetical protein
MTHVRQEKGMTFEARDAGHIVARVGISMTFFMKDWRGSEANVVAAYQRVRPLIEEQARWYRTGSMRGMGKIRKGTLDGPLVLTQAPPPKGAHFALTLTSGETGDDVGPVTFFLSLLDSAVEKEASAFHIALPLDWAKKPDMLRALFLDLARLLPFRSGLAGYATQVDEGEADPAADRACRGWLRRYLGIDSMHVIVVTDYVLNAIKGVNWLTAFDKTFAGKLGGMPKIKKSLRAPITVHELEHGSVIQAGPDPLLGDTYENEEMSLYKAVDVAIRPNRLRDDAVLPGFQDEDETAEWMARFE